MKSVIETFDEEITKLNDAVLRDKEVFGELPYAVHHSSLGVFDSRKSDEAKLSRVEGWFPLDNPVVGTCRNCGHRGLVDDPEVGLYKRGRLELAENPKIDSMIIPDHSGDVAKLSRVHHWAYVTNPVVGTCRSCKTRGLMDNPAIGILKGREPLPLSPAWEDWLNGD